MLSGIGLWAGGILVGVVAKQVIPKWWNSIMIKFRKSVRSKAQECLKNPEVRAFVAQGVALAQKQASKDSSINKLRLAGEWLKNKIPGPLDDAIIDQMIELVIEELKKDLVLG